jgi:hypothetical protein
MQWPTAIGLFGIGLFMACADGSPSTQGGTEVGLNGGSSGSSTGPADAAPGSGSSSGSDLNNGSSGSGGGSQSNGSSGSGGGSQSNGSSGSGGGSQSNGSSGSGGGSQSNSSSGTTSSSGGGMSTDSGSGGDSSSEQDATTGSPGPTASGGVPTMLPTVTGTCPTIAGANASMLTFAGEPVETWAGTGGGPLVLYWYPTTCNSSCILEEFGQTNIDAVTSMGGVVASFNKSTGTGTNTGDAVWYTGDFATADEVVACAIQELKIDTTRIYVTGASAGALQTTWMSYVRSGYVAAAVTLSGGLDELTAGESLTPTTLQDPSNVPSVMAVHGAPGSDVVIIDFAEASAAWEADIATKKGFSLDCNTGGGHVSGPPQILPGMWQFMLDHPFKVSPQPYPPIPAVYPSYCQIGPRAADGGAP